MSYNRGNGTICLQRIIFIAGLSNLASLLKLRGGGGEEPDHPLTPHSEDSDQLVNKSKTRCLCSYEVAEFCYINISIK